MLPILITLAALALMAGLAYGAYRYMATKGQGTTRQSKADRAVDERRLGYRYADDWIFIQGESVYTGVILDTTTDEYALPDEIAQSAMRPVGIYYDLLKFFGGRPVHAQEMVRYRAITSEGWLTQLLDHCWNPTTMYKTLAARLADHITGSTPQRIWVLIVRLGDLPRKERVPDPYAAAAGAVLGVAEESLTANDIAPWRSRANDLHGLLAAHGAEPLRRRDLLWCIRAPLFGHLPIPDEPVTRRRPWRGGFFELAAVLRGVNRGGGIIELTQRDPSTGEDGTSYTATLVLTDQPPRQIFNPRNAWSRRLSRLPNPVEIDWRYTLTPGAQWKKIAMRAVANVEDEAKDREKAGAGADLAFEARQVQAEQLKVDSGGDDPAPGMVGRLTLTVSAPTRGQLAKAIQQVKTAMGDIEVDVAEHGALLLLEARLPGEAPQVHLGSLSAGPAAGLSLWRRHTDPYAPALGLLGSYNQIGDRVQIERGRELGWIGIPIGYSKSNGTVVHFDPHAQIARLNGAGVAVVGASGGGKSSVSLLLFFYLSESGVRMNVLDPKVEFRNFVLYIAFGNQVLQPGFMEEADAGTLGAAGSRFQPVQKQFWDETVIIDLARGPRGSRCPWLITKTFAEGYDLALQLTDILFTNPDHQRIVKKGLRGLHNAHKDAEQAGRPFVAGFGDVVDYIRAERAEVQADLTAARSTGQNGSSARAELDLIDEVCTRLENGEEVPFLRLLLGKGTDRRGQTTGATKRRTIFTLAGYRPPSSADPKDWSDAERNAAAAMAVVLYGLNSALDGRLVPNPVTGRMGVPPSGVIVDEAPVVAALPTGRAFMRINMRQGRSLNGALFFIGQQARDPQMIEEESRREDGTEVNQFGSVMVFRQRSDGEARAALGMLRSVGEEMKPSDRDALAKKLLSESAPGGTLRPGEAAFRDPDNRVAGVVIDLVFHVLKRASQTNAQLHHEDWSHPVPADPADWTIDTEAIDRVRTAVAQLEEAEDFQLTPDELDDVADWTSHSWTETSAPTGVR